MGCEHLKPNVPKFLADLPCWECTNCWKRFEDKHHRRLSALEVANEAKAEAKAKAKARAKKALEAPSLTKDDSISLAQDSDKTQNRGGEDGPLH